MSVRMTTLSRSTRSGAWQARKAIPHEIRHNYHKAYGQGHEAKFSLPAGTPPDQAKRLFNHWHSEIEERFATLKNGLKAKIQRKPYREVVLNGGPEAFFAAMSVSHWWRDPLGSSAGVHSRLKRPPIPLSH